MSIHADTDGLLDRCACCGAVAGWESDSPPPLRAVQWRARCTECCEQTEYHVYQWHAMCEWNTEQRLQRKAMRGAE